MRQSRQRQSDAKAKQVCLEQSIESPLPPILGDPIRLQQVASNLLSNAIKFTPSGGRVDVVLRSAGSWVELVVRDTGVGISANFLPHVFDRFKQEQTTTARRGGGLGLGMAIVRNLVELHGGTVQVESAGQGQGTTFTVRLPVAAILPPPADQLPQRATSDEEPPSESHDLTGLRIHLVDDDALGRGMIATLLRSHGATVTESGTAADALKMIDLTPPDVLISYIGMPGEDGGYSLIREVRRLDAVARAPDACGRIDGVRQPAGSAPGSGRRVLTRTSPSPLSQPSSSRSSPTSPAESDTTLHFPGEFDKIGTLWVSEFCLQRTSG